MTQPQAYETKPNEHEQFAVYKLNDRGMANAKHIANSFNKLMDALEPMCAPGREFAIVKTKLEEACFFAKKSMAINLGNQQ